MLPAVLLLAAFAAACGGESADGVPDAEVNATHDAAIIDSATVADASRDAAVAADAPAPGFVIDGVVDPVEWGAAASYTNSVTVDAGFAGNGLDELRTYRDTTTLYLAITVYAAIP